MKVSVIVPAFNRELYIGSALRSLLRQRDAADLDIIVVDDGSTDGTAAAVRQLMSEASSIRLHSQPNMGVTKSRNAGLRLILPGTELVTFLDSDDISPAGRFAADLKYFRSDPALDLTYGLMTIVERIDETSLGPPPGSKSRTLRGIHLAAGIFRRATVDKIGYFDEDFTQGEDTDWLFRLLESRPRFVLSDTVTIYYRRHSGNVTNNKREGLREFLKAVLRSARRRRLNPDLGNIPFALEVAVFDTENPPRRRQGRSTPKATSPGGGV